MKITITSRNIDMTEKLEDYATQKIESLGKFFNNIISARIDLGKESTNHISGKIFYANVNLAVPGKTLRAEETEKSLEKAIDKAKDDLQRELKKYKAKFDKKNNESIRTMDFGTMDDDSDI